MISSVDHGDRVTSLITKVTSMEKEDAQLKAKVSDLESQIDKLKIKVILIISYNTFDSFSCLSNETCSK